MIVSPPPYEEDRKEDLNELQHQMAIYDEVQQRGDAGATEAEAQRVASAMRNVGDNQEDPKVKKKWHKKAEKFAHAANSARKEMLKEVGSHGIVMGLVLVPFHVLGIALSVTGGILHGVGGLLVGAGNIVSGAGSSRNIRPEGEQGSLGRDSNPTSRTYEFERQQGS